jgi:hypothetical protein
MIIRAPSSVRASAELIGGIVKKVSTSAKFLARRSVNFIDTDSILAATQRIARNQPEV